MTPYNHLEDLERRAELGGGEDRLRKQHDAGKLTARERIDLLFDPGTFEEIDKLVTHRCRDFGMEEQIIPGDGVVAGHGRVDGRPVYAFAQDFTVFGGSLSETNAAKIVKIMDLAMKMGAPVVGLNDSGGARIQEGVLSLGGYADIFLRNTLASGVMPQISAIMGPCAGGAVYSPAITDFNVMVEGTSYMFVTGPDVIKTVTHEEVTKEELGGAMTHNATSGVAHFAVAGRPRVPAADSRAARLPARQQRRRSAAASTRRDPVDREDARSTGSCPTSPNQPYDMHDLIHAIVDDGAFPRGAPALREEHHRRLRAARRPAGRHRRQPAGAPRRHARHRRVGQGGAVRAVLRRVQHPAGDVRGRPGIPAGHACRSTAASSGTARSCCIAFAEATVPKMTVITRKAYGGAYCVMSSKHIRTDVNFAWPTAEIAVMGPEGAVNILYKREIDAAADKEARAREAGRRVQGEVCQPLRRGVARLRRRSDPAAPDARRRLIAALAGSRPSATRTRRRSTGTSRSERQ